MGIFFMKNTILFDLDGTVLPMDFDMFMKLYFYNMGEHFKSVIESDKIFKYIMEATSVMIQTNNGDTNEKTFMNHFASLIDGSIDEYRAMFDNYYETTFENVKPSTYVSEYMIKSIKLLKEKGYTIALATNPLFPLKANHKRIAWAGLTPGDFDYISSFEQNKYCKPHVEYYYEVLESLGKKAEECIMIGNDVFDDLPASKIGIETYLIKEHLLNKNNIQFNDEILLDYEGFYQFAKKMKKII